MEFKFYTSVLFVTALPVVIYSVLLLKLSRNRENEIMFIKCAYIHYFQYALDFPNKIVY